jgi:hypothetical protein
LYGRKLRSATSRKGDTMDSKLFAHIKRTRREDKRRLFWWRMSVLWLGFSIFMVGVAVGRMI